MVTKPKIDPKQAKDVAKKSALVAAKVGVEVADKATATIGKTGSTLTEMPFVKKNVPSIVFIAAYSSVFLIAAVAMGAVSLGFGLVGLLPLILVALSATVKRFGVKERLEQASQPKVSPATEEKPTEVTQTETEKKQ